MEIFKLFGSIFVDTEQADESISGTNTKAKKFAETLGNGIKTAGKWAAGIGAAAVSIGASLGKAVNSAAEYADEIDKASFRSGIGAENLQRLKYAAEQSGATLENVEKSAKKVNERLGEVSEGNAKSAEMFEKLGVAVYDANGQMRSSDDVYDEVLSKLADMGDTAEATAIGTDLFGKAFVDLKPLLAAGSDGIQDLKDNADALGIVMSQDAVSAGVVYGDTIADIKSALGGMVNSIGSSVLPTFQKFADKIIEWIPTIRGMFDKLSGVLESTADKLLDSLFQIVENLLPPVLTLIGDLIPIVSEIVTIVTPIMADVLSFVGELLPPLIEIVEMILPLLTESLQFVGDLIEKAVKPAFEGLVAFLTGDWTKGIQKAGELYTGVFESAFAFIDGLFGTNLAKWYDDVTAFWKEAGAKLYEITHADQINENELAVKYGGLDSEIRQLSNQYMREGVSATEALDKAMNEILNTSEKLYYFNQHFADSVTAADAQARYDTLLESGQIGNAAYYNTTPNSGAIMASYYEQMGKAALNAPKLASGGVAYGQTLALIGDNTDAAVNPEVVAPLSELQALAQNKEDTQLLKDIKELLVDMKNLLGTRQQAVIEVKLSNGTKLASAMVDDINALIRNSGKNVFIQV